MIGEEDVARYQRELAEEAGGVQGAGWQEAGSADGKEEEGFFDDKELKEQEEQWQPKPVLRKGPFDDLFVGSSDQLVEPWRKKKASKGGKRRPQQEKQLQEQ